MFNRRLLIAKVNSTVGVPVNLYAETVYEITVQDDRFLPILEDTVFHLIAGRIP
jgi:hypothetical protein